MLVLRESQSYAIAIRHCTHQLESRLQVIASEAEQLNLKYVSGITSNVVEAAEVAISGLTAVNKLVSEGRLSPHRAILSVEEIKSRVTQECYVALGKLAEHQEQMKKDGAKLENLIMSILDLVKLDMTSRIKESITNKQEKIQELLDGIPTYSKISQLLRVDLQRGHILERVKKSMEHQARRLQSRIEGASEEEESEINKMIDSDYEKNLEIEKADVLKDAKYLVAMVLDITVEDCLNFVNGTLPKVNEQFFNKEDKLIRKAWDEALAE